MTSGARLNESLCCLRGLGHGDVLEVIEARIDRAKQPDTRDQLTALVAQFLAATLPDYDGPMWRHEPRAMLSMVPQREAA